MAIEFEIQDSNRLEFDISDPQNLEFGTRDIIEIRQSGDYNDLTNRPSVNGVELIGNKTTEELLIDVGVKSWNGQTGDVVYTPPEVPVQSVNGQTGDVVLNASDVGALPANTPIPSKTSDLQNDSGYITGITSGDVTSALGFTPYNATNPNGYVNATQAKNAAPVQSVNGKTGAVVLDAEDVGAMPEDTEFAIGYDESVSLGGAVVGEAVTGEPNYTPSGTVAGSVTTSRETFMTGGGTMVNTHYANYKLYFDSVSLVPTTTTKNFVTGIGDLTFTGNGVKFAVEQEQ